MGGRLEEKKAQSVTGLCSVCGTALRPQAITFTQTVGDKTYIVTDVPADVCPQCGETYLAPNTVDALQELIAGGKALPTRTVEVPVYQFQPTA